MTIAYKRVRRALLNRYIAEDYGWSQSSNPQHVPRFLHNDVARYWRTVAVDFAYKRKDRGGEGGALRTVKLRLSRKLTYAAGLIACFRCSMLSDLHQDFTSLTPEERAQVAIGEMEAFLSHTPLEILAWAFIHFGWGERLSVLLGAYDRFLEILDSKDREHLDELPLDTAASDPLFQEARTLGHRFQDGLTALFLTDEEGVPGPFYDLTRTYGVF